MDLKERYSCRAVGVNTAVEIDTVGIGGFLALTSGTLTVAFKGGDTLLNAVPVTAGIYTPMPFAFGKGSAQPMTLVFTTAGGASGYLAL